MCSSTFTAGFGRIDTGDGVGIDDNMILLPHGSFGRIDTGDAVGIDDNMVLPIGGKKGVEITGGGFDGNELEKVLPNGSMKGEEITGVSAKIDGNTTVSVGFDENIFVKGIIVTGRGVNTEGNTTGVGTIGFMIN